MRCSTQPHLLPEVIDEKREEQRAQNTDVICAWELDLNAWRSFRVDSVLTFEAVETESNIT